MNITNQQYLYTIGLRYKHCSNPSAVYDKDGNFVSVNKAFKNVFGLEGKEIIGKSLLRLEHNLTEHSDIINEQNNSVVYNRVQLFSLHIIKTHSSCTAFYVSKMPLINERGDVIGIDVNLYESGLIHTFSASLNDTFNKKSAALKNATTVINSNKLNDTFTPLQETYSYFILCGFSNEFISGVLNRSKKTVENNISRLIDKAQTVYCGGIFNRRSFREYLISNNITNLSPAGIMNSRIQTISVSPFLFDNTI
ncbi:PAS domain-containing protein [Photobacterium sp. ZSDE20]|nr:PAS domain-containing protein [Photobacterium sp. ZSDE20]